MDHLHPRESFAVVPIEEDLDGEQVAKHLLPDKFLDDWSNSEPMGDATTRPGLGYVMH